MWRFLCMYLIFSISVISTIFSLIGVLLYELTEDLKDIDKTPPRHWPEPMLIIERYLDTKEVVSSEILYNFVLYNSELLLNDQLLELQ
jgi:hypothetical protein